jgi:hypothetical protein
LPTNLAGGEHELAIDAEEVEHPAPLRRIEGAHGVPTLVQQEAVLGQFLRLSVRMARLGLGHGIGEDSGQAVARHVAQPVLELRVDEVVEEVRQLHHMAVGVEDAPLPHIGRRLHPTHQPFRR